MYFVMLKQFAFVFILLPVLAFAQSTPSNTDGSNGRMVADSLGHGVVTFVASPSVLALEKNSRGLNNLQGYRIQIFFGPLDQAKAKRQEYMGKGLIHQAYLEQNVPDFSLRIGDFLTESEARQELKNLRSIYPNAFLVKGHIEPPNLNYYINAIKEPEN
jgi:hypothetical protein